MLRYIIIFIGCLIVVKSGIAQTTFNQRFNWSSSALAGNVWVEDDGYVCSGIYNDTIGDTDRGLFIRKVDLEGNTMMEKFYSRDEWDVFNFEDAGCVLENGNNLLATYLKIDGIDYCQLWWFDQNWDSLQTRKYASPYADAPINTNLIYPRYVATDLSGNIYVTCQISNINSSDFNILKIDSVGNVQWEYLSSWADENDVCYCLYPADNGVIMACARETPWIFNNSIEEHVAKLITSDANAPMLEWDVIVNPTINGHMFELIVTTEDIILAAGYSEPTWSATVPCLISIDNEGNTNWEIPATMAYYPQYRMQHVVQTADGGYLGAAREIDETITPTPEDGNVNENCLLAKYNGNGELLWTRRYHNVSSPDDQHKVNDLKLCADGGFIFCGEATNLAEDNNGNNLDSIPQQGWLVKVTAWAVLYLAAVWVY